MVGFTVFKGSESGEITQATTDRQVGDKEVLVKITHSGLCGTDVHYKKVDQGLGHEGVGIVEYAGKDVTQYKTGDRVGWGYVHDTCGHCKQCLRGKETFCPERKLYGASDLDQGSMGTYAVWNEDFLFSVPEAMQSSHAAPLMCGGATVFTVLREYGVVPSDRVGVIGIGGLGHLAIQFAAKMGCEVVVFSGTDSKKEEATKLGATEFYATKGAKEIKVDRKIDALIITTSVPPDWSLYVPILAPNAVLFPITAAQGDMNIPYRALTLGGLRVQGSLVAARQTHREMLQFAAVHNIAPIIQEFPMSVEGITEAFEKLETGKMRYRGVLVV